LLNKNKESVMADRPLHLIMRDAHLEKVRDHPGWRAGGEAAMLRALADVVVPEESNIVPEGDLVEQAYRQDERFRIRQRLLDEATRAERGAV
jgi:hypothetical protein